MNIVAITFTIMIGVVSYAMGIFGNPVNLILMNRLNAFISYSSSFTIIISSPRYKSQNAALQERRKIL